MATLIYYNICQLGKLVGCSTFFWNGTSGQPFGGESLPTSGCIGFISDTRGTETIKKYWDDPAELSVPVNEIYHDISYILCWVILGKKSRKLCVHHLKHVDMFFNRTKRVLACSSPVLFGLNSANVFVHPGSCHLRETVSFPGSS